jgi:cytochrome c peroxidase
MKALRLFAGCAFFAAALLTLRLGTAGEAEEAPTPVSIGAKIFADPGLSASGDLACATCHAPARAHAVRTI